MHQRENLGGATRTGPMPDRIFLLPGTGQDGETTWCDHNPLSDDSEAREYIALPMWQPMETCPLNGDLVLLLVSYGVSDAFPLEDDRIARTIGHKGADGWQFAGWNWCHDHYTAGTGTPIRWAPLPDLPPEHDPVWDGGSP